MLSHNLKRSFNQGFTLIELMITVAVIGVIAAIAVPSYNGYVQTTCLGTAAANVKIMRAYLENYHLENGTYLTGVHTAGDTTNALMTGLHWNPDDDGTFTYTVSAGTTGNISSSYDIKAEGITKCTNVTDYTDGN